jgi:hypothetical protein
MDKLKEIIDQLKDQVMARWDRFQESDTYISLREKYDNLPPKGQKLVVFSSFALAILIIFSIPYAWFSASQGSVAEFEDTKHTMAELLEVSQEIKNIPPVSIAVTSADLKMKVDRILSEKGLNKDQIAAVNETQFTNPQGSTLIPQQINASGVETNLKKLTLKQVVDLGFEFEHISPMVKVLNLEMKATPEDMHFYDVQFRVSSFSVKEAPAAPGQAKNPKR